MLKVLNSGDYEGVPNQIKRWNKVSGQVNDGLIRRREAEALLFEGKHWEHIQMALSKTQNKRLGVILSVMFKEETPQELLQDVIRHGFVEKVDNTFQLTDKGIDEKNRLCTLSGLNIKYSSEK